MKAVYAVLSLMLAASLAWAGSGGEVGACDRCEVEEQYQAPMQGIERQRDDIRFDVELDRNRPDYRPELGIAPSEYDCYGSQWAELGIAPSENDVERGPGYRVETGIAPSSYGWAELGIAPSRSDVESELKHQCETGIAPSNHDVEALPRHPELGVAPRNSDVEVELVAPVPVREFSSSSTGDDGWPPPYTHMRPDAEYDHFPPPSARVLPPLEFDGSNHPSEWTREAPPVEFDGGLPKLEVEQPPAVAW